MSVSEEGEETSAKSSSSTSHRLSISVRTQEVLDASVFTFKPKVSSASVKIVESLGSDFMGRQLQHLEKQRRNTSTMAPALIVNPLYKSVKRKNSLSKSISVNRTGSPDKSPDHTMTKDSEPIKGHNSDLLLSAGHTPRVGPNWSCGGKTHGGSKVDKPKENPPTPANSPIPTTDATNAIVNTTSNNADNLHENTDIEVFDPPETLTEADRSRTLPISPNRPRLPRRMSSVNGDRLYQAKLVTERAVKNRKIFTIQGGYHAIRQSLRRRGWVEKFYTKPLVPNRGVKVKKAKVDGDDDDGDISDDADDDDDGADDDYKNAGPKVPPWEEEDGLYGIMSRMIKYATPTFYWVLKRDVVDQRQLAKDQIINHYCRAGSFTTKIGLCVNMRNVPWYEEADPTLFFPRCYRLCNDDDKEAFIDDYRLTACIAVLQLVIKIAAEQALAEKKAAEATSDMSENASYLLTNDAMSAESEYKPLTSPRKSAGLNTPRHAKSKKPRPVAVPLDVVQLAIEQCQRHISFVNHDDIDTMEDPYLLNDEGWNKLLVWYYQLRSPGAYFEEPIPSQALEICRLLVGQLAVTNNQYKMDGTRNVWILKPGAKSRGRGITCYNKLEDMLKLVKAQVTKSEGKYVVQKYIERPLLIYNTKFDIRQWFLVTDWNPLTMYFYQDCYLRFCSQQYTLDNFDEAVHLSNNSIQKHYKNGPRSENLPPENMWSHYEFIHFLKERGCGEKWDDLIYPGMKAAVTCALLATQDHVEYRKSSFELYGADFMLTEDYSPWLIEINSSPSMEKSTAITAHLCDRVLDDTVKVVVDRKTDKNCDIGRFELAYKQSHVTVPPYIGLHMSVEGTSIRRTEERRPRNEFKMDFIKDKDDSSDSESSDFDCSDSSGKENKSKKKTYIFDKYKRRPVETDSNSTQTSTKNTAVLKLQHTTERTPLGKKLPENTSDVIKPLSKKHKEIPDYTPKLKDYDKILPPVFDGKDKTSVYDITTDNPAYMRKSGSDIIEYKLANSLVTPNKSLYIPSNGSFPSKRSKRFVSRTSVANSYPVLPLPSTLQFEKPQTLIVDSATWEKSSSLLHSQQGSKPVPLQKNLFFPLPGKSDLKKAPQNRRHTRDIKRLQVLSNLPLVPYAAVDIEKVVAMAGGATRLKYFNVSRQLSEASIIPPPKKSTSNPQKGIFIHPSSY